MLFDVIESFYKDISALHEGLADEEDFHLEHFHSTDGGKTQIEFTFEKRKHVTMVHLTGFILFGGKSKLNRQKQLQYESAFVQCFVNEGTSLDFIVLVKDFCIPRDAKFHGGVFDKNSNVKHYYVWRPL